MVNGPSPGPPPADQARANNSRLTRSSCLTWPHWKLRKNVPRVDGAFTVPPSARAVPPVRNTSASSMQSPPANAEATNVSTLSPALARPGARPRSTWFVDQFTQTQMLGQRDWQDQTGIGHQAVIVEGDLDAVRVLRW